MEALPSISQAALVGVLSLLLAAGCIWGDLVGELVVCPRGAWGGLLGDFDKDLLLYQLKGEWGFGTLRESVFVSVGLVGPGKLFCASGDSMLPLREDFERELLLYKYSKGK